jgi:DNA-binding MarR family transcriptional regulator
VDRIKAGRDIMDLFIQGVRKYNALEKVPVWIGSKHPMYPSERHFLNMIGEHQGVNITEFANATGITKGAVSQIVNKLENKGFVRRYKSGNNNKEVFLELTRDGLDIYIKNKKTNDETIKPLIERLKKYSDDEVDFLISMFRWIGEYLDHGRKQMNEHR